MGSDHYVLVLGERRISQRTKSSLLKNCDYDRRVLATHATRPKTSHIEFPIRPRSIAQAIEAQALEDAATIKNGLMANISFDQFPAAERAVVSLAAPLNIAIYDPILIGGQHGRDISKCFGEQHISCAQEIQVSAARCVDAPVHRVVSPVVPFGDESHFPRMVVRQLPCDLDAAIRGSAIHDQVLKIRGLRQNGRSRARKLFAGIKVGGDDAERRHVLLNCSHVDFSFAVRDARRRCRPRDFRPKLEA